jgi:hypothetical protein
MCMPGDNVVMDVELITPIAIEEGLRFAIREGGRTVGSGVVIIGKSEYNIKLTPIKALEPIVVVIFLK